MLSVEKIPMSASEHNLSTQPAAKRHPLLVPVGTTFPPQAGAQQPVLYLVAVKKPPFAKIT